MLEVKENTTIHSVYLPTAIALSIALPLFIFGYATYYNAVQIFLPFVFILPIICCIAFIVPAVRNVRVDIENKVIIIKDGLGSAASIPFGSIKSITKEGGWHIVSFQEGEQLIRTRFILGIYTTQNQKRILDLIQKFNPGVST